MAIGAGEDVARRVEAAIERLERADGHLVGSVDPRRPQERPCRARLLDPALEVGGVGVVAGLHLGQEQGQELGPEVHLSSYRRPPRVGQLGELLGCAHDRLVLPVGVHAVRRLGAVGHPGAGVEVDGRLAAAGQVALAGAHVLEGAPASDGEGGEHVEGHQAHAGHGDGSAGGKGLVEVVDRIGTQEAHAGRVAAGLVVEGVAGGQDHMVDAHGRAVVEQHRLAAPDLW